MDFLFDQRFEQHVQFGKVIGCKVIVLGQRFGFQTKRTSRFTDIAIFNDNGKMLADAIPATLVIAIEHAYNLKKGGKVSTESVIRESRSSLLPP